MSSRSINFAANKCEYIIGQAKCLAQRPFATTLESEHIGRSATVQTSKATAFLSRTDQQCTLPCSLRARTVKNTNTKAQMHGEMVPPPPRCTGEILAFSHRQDNGQVSATDEVPDIVDPSWKKRRTRTGVGDGNVAETTGVLYWCAQRGMSAR